MSAGSLSGIANSLTAQSSFGASQPQDDKFADLESQDFLNIILTELTNQDPLDPQDTSALVQQISDLRNIESQLSLQTGLEALVSQNAIVQASSLVGQTVEYESEILGVNTSARVSTAKIQEDGSIRLELDNGDEIPIEDVLAVSQDRDVIQPQPQPQSQTGTPGGGTSLEPTDPISSI